MNEIKCPHCGEVFQVDERGFADIVRQVRTQEFDKEIAQREGMLKQQNEQAVALAVSKVKSEAQNAQATSEARIAELEAKLAAALEQSEQAAKASEKEMQQVQQAERQKADADIKTALAEKQAEIAKLQAEVEKLSADQESQKRATQAEHEKSLIDATAKRDAEIATLKTQIASQEANRIAVEGILAEVGVGEDRSVATGCRGIGEAAADHRNPEAANRIAIAAVRRRERSCCVAGACSG